MSLKAWLDKCVLRKHKTSKKEIAGLFALADRNLADARSAGLSVEGRFQFAYNAVLTSATVALRASGYRTNSNVPGHHAVTIESLTHTVGTDAVRVAKLDAFRGKRNRVSYDVPVAVSGAEADELDALAVKLRHDIERWLRSKHRTLI